MMLYKKTAKVRSKIKGKPNLIKKLDTVFSLYIRLKYARPNGMCKCISCGTYKSWKEIQNGHYMSRRYMSTRFDEDNCRPQCVSCNIFNQGNIQMYRRGLIKQIGEQRVDLIEYKAKSMTKQYSEFELTELIKYYSKLVEKLKEEKGL